MSSELPEGWSSVPVGDVCALVNGRAFKPEDWGERGLPIVRIQNLNNAGARFNYYDGSVDSRFYIDSGELLFAWSGTPGTSFGAHVWRGGRAILNQHIFRVLFDEHFIDKEFLRLSINERLEHLIHIAHGGVGLRHVTKPVFESTEIQLAPLNEQRRIVAKVEALMARSRRAKEALEAIPPLLDQLRKSILAAAFRGDVTADWREEHPDVEPASELLKRIRAERRRRWEEAELAKMKAKGKKPGDDRWKEKYEEPEPVDESELPELPEGWCWANIVTLAEVKGGKRLPKGSEYADGPTRHPYIRVSDFQNGTVATAELRYISPEVQAEVAQYTISSRDLYISIAGTIGVVGRVPECLDGANLTENAAKICPPRICDLDYLAQYLSSPAAQDHINDRTVSTTQPKLALFRIESLPVPLPPQDEQAQIVQRLRAVLRDQELQVTLSGARSQLASLDSAILAKAFRGELVPQDPNDEPASVLLERIRHSSGKPSGGAGRGRRRNGGP